MASWRTIGGMAGLLVGIGVAVWVGIVSAAPWEVIAFGAFLLGTLGARIGSLTRPSIWEHKLLIQIGSVLGAIGGVLLGICLVHDWPPKGDFGWQVVVCSAMLAFLGLLLPLFVMSRLVPVCCPRCGGPAYLGTESSFFRKLLARYHYRCRSCEYVEEFGISQGWWTQV